MRTALALLAAMLFATAASALSLADISAKDAGGGLREALTQGAGKAVGLLGRQDGFLGNPAVRIALPENLQKVEGAMRKLGMGRQADELVTAMNRAAEAAVPQARALLLNSIRQMSLDDAKGILAGGEDSATQYFRRTTSGPMAEKFRPVVRGAMAKVKLAEKCEQDAHLENYVTQKTLDGLYLMIAEEEKTIRKDPAGAAGKLAKMVFGALK